MNENLHMQLNSTELDQLVEVIMTNEPMIAGFEDVQSELVGKAIAFTRIYFEYKVKMKENADVLEIINFLSTLDERLGIHDNKPKTLN